jgi:hypothetical protein
MWVFSFIIFINLTWLWRLCTSSFMLQTWYPWGSCILHVSLFIYYLYKLDLIEKTMYSISLFMQQTWYPWDSCILHVSLFIYYLFNLDLIEKTLYTMVSWYWNQDHCQAGEGSFCCISLQNMIKHVFGPWAASSQVYTFRAMQYIWVKNDFFTI